jgi:hypothetical protein
VIKFPHKPRESGLYVPGRTKESRRSSGDHGITYNIPVPCGINIVCSLIERDTSVMLFLNQ